MLWLIYIWAPSSEFMSSSIPSWQTLTAHAQTFRGARDLAFCLKVPLDSLLVWASSGGSGETARMRRLAWTFAARIGDKYQIRLTRSICIYFWFLSTCVVSTDIGTCWICQICIYTIMFNFEILIFNFLDMCMLFTGAYPHFVHFLQTHMPLLGIDKVAQFCLTFVTIFHPCGTPDAHVCQLVRRFFSPRFVKCLFTFKYWLLIMLLLIFSSLFSCLQSLSIFNLGIK